MSWLKMDSRWMDVNTWDDDPCSGDDGGCTVEIVELR